MPDAETYYRQLQDEIAELRVRLDKYEDAETEQSRVDQAEQKLRIRNKAIESSLSGFVITDFDGKLTYANPAFLEMWGLDNPDELRGPTRPARG